MNKLSLAALAIAITAAFAAATLAGNDNDTQVVNEIAGYQQWTKVNAEPVKVEVLKTETDPISLASGATLV